MHSQTYFNPYAGQDFFGFFGQLILRLFGFLKGDIAWNQLATDEIQILVLVGVALSSALVGSFLVLRKMTMLANSLSHTILIGIVFVFLWSGVSDHHHGMTIDIKSMLLASLLMALLTAFFTELLSKGARLQEDASTGLVFTSLFAIGLVALTVLTRNAHIGTEVVMGNVDALQLQDFKLVGLVFGINVLLFILFFKEYKITTFDSSLAKALAISPIFFNYLLMTQVSFTVISAFRAVGVLMVLAFITGPALTARLLTHDLKKMLLFAMGIGALTSLIGVALSRHVLTVYDMALSTGGLVVCVIVLFYVIVAAFYLYKRRRLTSDRVQFNTETRL